MTGENMKIIYTVLTDSVIPTFAPGSKESPGVVADPSLKRVRVHLPGAPSKGNVVQNYWRRIRGRAGINISLYQGTKHSGGSQAINAGVDLQVIQHMFGHKDPRTTLRYLSVATEKLKDYWDRPQTVPNGKKQKANLLDFKKK
jgi:hypothetical protein